ncbi:hypothetical protein [Streptomyces sp. NPDC002265]|uniref:hypothetical protein n=1 Tax=Streptomyces sp. NPDC002265 TaxID=3154415 RepID=UPI00332109C1
MPSQANPTKRDVSPKADREGIEALALTHHASMWAKQITKITGDDVDGIELDAMEPVLEVEGLADNWWRGTDSLVAIYTGEARCLSFPRGRTALIYSGLDKWGLYGGVGDGSPRAEQS